MRVAAYCRVSTDTSDQANSLASQQLYFKEYIERNPMWELYDIYVDEGITGTSTKKRKAFNRMMADAQLKKFDYIITKEISRFARNTLDSIYYTRKLKEYGIGVIFANDNLFTLDPDAELRLTIMASIAQEESRKTSERVKWGQKRRMEQGVVFGRDMVGYDVRYGKLFINPEGAKVVQQVFHKYTIEHKGTTTIARELNEAGVPTFTNSNWTNTVILRMLRNEKYCGDLVQKKTITPNYLTHEKKYNHGEEELVIIRDHHEPIISRELFELTKKEMKRRAPSKEQKSKLGNRYCFSGKIVCAECDSSYVFHNKKLSSGKRYKYWECYQKRIYGKKKHIDETTGKEVGCESVQVGHDNLKELMECVVSTLNLNQKKYLKMLEKQISETLDTTQNTSYDEQRELCDKKVERRKSLVDLYLDKCISKDEFKQMSASLDSEIAKLQETLKNSGSNYHIDEKSKQQAVSECVAFAKNILANNGNDDEFIRQLLDKMTIDKNRNITIKLNLLPYKWKFALSTLVSGADNFLFPHSVTDVPVEYPQLTLLPYKQYHFSSNSRNENLVFIKGNNSDKHYKINYEVNLMLI
jgi:DNA invertase Pin-like site-specific DNA recombinase